VWEKAHKITLDVYIATQAFPKEERFGLTSQLRRASASIAANLAEGCGRRSDREMSRFIQIAMGSGAELSYHLLLSKDLGYLRDADFGRLTSALDEIMRMLSSLSGRLKNPSQSAMPELRAKG
jgi:four helix bundle protein